MPSTLYIAFTGLSLLYYFVLVCSCYRDRSVGKKTSIRLGDGTACSENQAGIASSSRNRIQGRTKVLWFFFKGGPSWRLAIVYKYTWGNKIPPLVGETVFCPVSFE